MPPGRAKQPSDACRPGLVPDCAAFVVDRCVPAHLGDALRVEVSDVRAACKHRPDKTRAYALDLQESVGQVFHPLVIGYGLVAPGLYPRNLPVKSRDGAFKMPARIPVADVLKLVVHDCPCLHEVPAHADALFQPLLRFGAGLDEVELFVLEGCRVVADHLAVDPVRLFDAPLGFGEPARAPGVKAYSPYAFCEAFVRERLFIRPRRLEADDGIGPRRSLDHFSPAGLDVSDCFLLPVRVADVEPFLADIHPDVHSDLIHDILSLSSSYRDAVSRMPFQPYRLWLMKMQRRPDSPAMYMHLGGNGLTAAAWGGWPSAPGILFASPRGLGYPNTYWAGTVG